jgi:hypothetical protein
LHPYHRGEVKKFLIALRGTGAVWVAVSVLEHWPPIVCRTNQPGATIDESSPILAIVSGVITGSNKVLAFARMGLFLESKIMTITEPKPTLEPIGDASGYYLIDGMQPNWSFHPALAGKVQDYINTANLEPKGNGTAVLHVESCIPGKARKNKFRLDRQTASEILMLENHHSDLLPPKLKALLPKVITEG